MKNKKDSKPVEVGSRRWYLSMIIGRLSLVMLPLMTGIYATLHTEWDAPRDVVLALAVPWYAITVSLVLLAHALFRIEVNVANNSTRPFTKKDSHVFHRNVSITVGLAFGLAVLSLFTEPGDMPEKYKDIVADSMSTSLILFVVVATISTTVSAIHRKAMQTHENLTKAKAELEGGV